MAGFESSESPFVFSSIQKTRKNRKHKIMSVKLMTKVWESIYAKHLRGKDDKITKSHAKLLVMLKLADCASDEGFCFPGQNTIANSCGLERETVNRICKEIEIDKKLEIIPRVGRGNYYKLFFESLDTDLPDVFDVLFRDVTSGHTSSGDDAESGRVISGHNPCDLRSQPPVISGHNIEPSEETSVNHQSGLDGKQDKKGVVQKASEASASSDDQTGTPAAAAPTPAKKVFKKTRKSAKAEEETDEEFLSRMKKVFAHCDVDFEFKKAESWTIRKGRDLTRAFFEGWLGRIKKDTSSNILKTASSDAPTNGAKPESIIQDGEVLKLGKDGKYHDATGRVIATERESVEEKFKRKQLEKKMKDEGENK